MSDAPLQRTPSQTDRKNMPPSVNRSTRTPGHIADVQQMFHSARASLRLDMAFAASPTGSIGSRLPSDKTTIPGSPSSIAQGSEKTPVKDWRYSLAPQLVAASDLDVREPVPEGSPMLPGLLCIEDDGAAEPALEHLSSGFNSPVEALPANSDALAIAEIDDGSENIDEFHDAIHRVARQTELDRTMTELKVCSDDENGDVVIDDWRIASHLKTTSAETSSVSQPSESDEKEIFLSEPAEAAAQSAKTKRSLLRRLFPRKAHGSSPISDIQSASSNETASHHSPCPDPSLHKLISMGTCPDPIAHLRLTPPNLFNGPMISITPEAALTLVQHTPSPTEGSLLPPAPPFHRASSTGSPMPFARPHTVKSSPGPIHDAYRQSCYGPRPPPHARSQLPFRPQTRNGYPDMASEHFQPGWYYAQEPSLQPANRLNPMPYSFSTAAAKVVGQSAAPDSRIRDSYRTDTLTPLAKPPSRFRKTGMGALASAHGVSKYYDPPDRMNSRTTRPGTSLSHRTRDTVQFRSSPPRAPENMAFAHQKRRRPRELEDEHFDLHEDGIGQNAGFAGSGEPIRVEERTRAAVRLSLYGPKTPEALQGEREGLKEISPNVTSWRKGMRQPKKKRRPSYWDGDLEHVRESPARRQEQVRSLQPGAERHVMTSPAKEDVESMRVSVRDSVMQENVGVEGEHPNGELEEAGGADEEMQVGEGEVSGKVDEMEVERESEMDVEV